MNRYFLHALILLLGLITFVSCKPEAKNSEPDTLSVSPTILNFLPSAETQKITIETSTAWSITGMPDWVTVSPSKGIAGKTEITITAAENNSGMERQARLTVEAGSLSLFLPIQQMPKGTLELKEKTFIVIGATDKLIVPYIGTVEPEIVIPANAQSWIKVLSTRSAQEHRIVLGITPSTDVFRSTEVQVINTPNNISDKFLIKQYPQPVVKFNSDSYFLKYSDTEFTLNYETNIPLDVALEDNKNSWITISKQSLDGRKGKIDFTFTQNESKTVNDVSVSFVNTECDVTYRVRLSQMFKANDNDAVLFHSATYQPGTIIGDFEYKKPTFIFTGDGFTKEDIENGTYDKYMQISYKAIFETEPFKTHKNRFNAWMIYAESNADGVTPVEEYQQGKIRDTKYQVYFYDTSRGMQVKNFDQVINDCKKIVTNAGGYYNEETGVVVIVSKSSVYGGTCMLDKKGRAIALCPLATDESADVFPLIVAHEAGGHGFGKLADEYSTGGTITDSEKRGLLDWQKSNIYLNVSLEFDAKKVPWAWLIGTPGYSDVGVFNGGYYASNGVTRSTETSIMRDNLKVKEFNAYSRYLIFKRLYDIYDNPDNMGIWFPTPPEDPKTWFFKLDKPNAKN